MFRSLRINSAILRAGYTPAYPRPLYNYIIFSNRRDNRAWHHDRKFYYARIELQITN